jgi:hypothetical protein
MPEETRKTGSPDKRENKESAQPEDLPAKDADRSEADEVKGGLSLSYTKVSQIYSP